MGRFRTQQLLSHIIWSTCYKIPLNDRYSNYSTQWTLVVLYFTVKKYGRKLTYEKIDTALGKKSISIITKNTFCTLRV